MLDRLCDACVCRSSFEPLKQPPAVALQVISDAHGNAKGKVGNPLADPPLRPDGKLNVGGAVGKGVLAVVRSNAQAERPFTGRAAAALGTCHQAHTVGSGMKATVLDCVEAQQPLYWQINQHLQAAMPVTAHCGHEMLTIVLSSLSQVDQPPCSLLANNSVRWPWWVIVALGACDGFAGWALQDVLL